MTKVVLSEANLRTGASVDPGEEISQPFFSVPGHQVKVNGQDVQVYEYPNESLSLEESKKISPDGYSIGFSNVSWIKPPHFYRKEKVIVLYLGDDKSIQDQLTNHLGPQFAGR